MASFWEILMPPLVALLIYVFIVYVFLPLYRQRQQYAQYMPISLPSGTLPNNLVGDWRDRIFGLVPPSIQNRLRPRRYSGLSDESMDPADGFEELHEHLTGNVNAVDDDQPRLSRDLEAGFRRDSDDETSRR